MTTDQLLAIWAILETDFRTIDWVRNWSERALQDSIGENGVVLELCTAKDKESALAMCAEELARTDVPSDDRAGRLLVGMLYRRYADSSLSWEQFVNEVGDVLDSYESSVIDPRDWYAKTSREDSVPDNLRRTLDQLALEAGEVLLQLR
jgi:hypothetical protein